MANVSRLYRVLRAAGVTAPNIFMTAIGGGYGGIPANQVCSVAMHRGKNARGGGVDPSTLELVTTRMPNADSSGYLITFDMDDTAAAELGATLGIAPDLFKNRYHGRIGKISIDDQGKRQTTTLMAASWITMLNYVRRTITPHQNQSLYSVINDLCLYEDSPYGISLDFHGTSDRLSVMQDPTNFKDGIDKYSRDVGVLVRARRDGGYDVMSNQYRKDLADLLILSRPHLTRSAAISPAQWEQPNESVGVQIDYTAMNDATDTLFTERVDTYTGEMRTRELEEIDWSYVATTPGGMLYREAAARVYERSPRSFRVPSVTIDLLYLLTSKYPHHQRQAAALLMLDAGDPVFFSGDWPAMVRGVQYAEGITETVTPNEWSITLHLYPYAQVTGYEDSPTVPAQTWDAATYPWDTETRKWDEA